MNAGAKRRRALPDPPRLRRNRVAIRFSECDAASNSDLSEDDAMGASLPLLVVSLAIGGAEGAGPDKESKPAKLLFTLKVPDRESSRSVQFSPDGARLACAGW